MMIPITDKAVAVLDAQTGDVVLSCDGPAVDGTCPLAQAGDTVPCASQRIVAGLDTRARFRLHVPAGSTECPLSWLLADHLG